MRPDDYFPPADDCPTFVDDTEWYPLVDGVAYFTELDDHLARAGRGDSVFVAGLEVDADLDLHGRAPGDDGYAPLGRRLAELAARGVDVRVILASRVFPSSLPRGVLPFRPNAITAERLRAMTVAGATAPPLAGRVLLDFSGALLGSNHQKNVVLHIGGELTAFVAGIDLTTDRYDRTPHDTMRLEGHRWGWHDTAVRLRGPAATRVWDTFAQRWQEGLQLPDEHWFESPRRRLSLNPKDLLPAPASSPPATPSGTPGVSVRVLRSTFRLKIDSRLPFRRRRWATLPPRGLQEVYATLAHAINAAQRYIYMEDQYLEESVGGDEAFELWPFLRAAAVRGVKVILVGSGTRDPEDIDVSTKPINRELNDDLREKLVDPLAEVHRLNVAVYRVEHCTVHSKLTLIDDVFANIGSANMFSRSMSGADSELTAAVTTSTTLVRDVRVQVWSDHLRSPLTDELRASLEDLDLALGIWRRGWLPDGAAPQSWLLAGTPSGYDPSERVLALVGPPPPTAEDDLPPPSGSLSE